MLRKSAAISACGRYRWSLSRIWGPGIRATFILLNPSVADAEIDDPTLRRCIGFAKRENCGGLTVVNLFAFRTSDPKLLLRAEDPEGPENQLHLRMAVEAADMVICGWGAHPVAQKSGQNLVQAFPAIAFRCLGKSGAGAPRHPLYLKSDAELRPFP
ncbi:DUF1643 domain-containing protein [Hyphomonas sp.]|uniref:DUF1643 domain-containing protein n=1 Tax=Hyphomonas sp. TaxID=87 RepID=UPI003455C787